MKRPHTGVFLALILAAAALGAIAAWAPLAACPRCLGRPLEVPLVGPGSFHTGPPAGWTVASCEACDDRRRVSWLRKRRWTSPAIPIGTEFLPPPR